MELLERVELLERETSALKRRVFGWRSATGALVVIGLFASCKAAPPTGAQTAAPAVPAATAPQKELTTQTLNVTDAQGRPRAALGVADNGSVVLAMMDRESKVRISMAITPEGDSLLTMVDKKGKPRTIVGIDAKDVPVVATIEPDGSKNDLTGE